MYNSRRVGYFLVLSIICIKFWSYIIEYRLPALKVLQTKPVSNPQELRVLSYNVYLRPPMVSHTHGDYKNQRCSLICKILHLFDVVLLQEVHTCLNFRCNTIIEEATKQGLPYHVCTYGPSVFSRHISNNGLMILSRYPIIDKSSLSFTSSSTYDSIIEKGAIYGQLQLSHGIQVGIVNTHLQSSYYMEDTYAEETRSQQLKQLRTWMDAKRRTTNCNFICGGDFNINSGNKIERMQLYEHMGRDLCDAFEGSKASTIIIPFQKNKQEDTSLCMACRKCSTVLNHVHRETPKGNWSPRMKHVHPEMPTDKLEENSLSTVETTIICVPQRLDYIFHNTELQILDHQILPMRITDTRFPFHQLSDHKAVYTRFKLCSIES